ncbi:MAG: anaerobic ribonucleoside-triphosphate reductase activating protein [Pseudobdellovibrionaceae bacterium]
MNIYNYDIVFQEVPHHVSLAFYVTGCNLHCSGCHSPELWPQTAGYPLTVELYTSLLDKYRNRIDCVLFLGGEWNPLELMNFLKLAKEQKLETALYTGLEDIPNDIKANLTFLKTGPWKKELGGLSSLTTNQIFKNMETNQILNHLFQVNQ